MAKIDEKALTKGELRKLNALRKSIGDELGTEAFAKWLAKKPQIEAQKVDRVAELLAEIMKPYVEDKRIKLGVAGYTIKKARGRGVEAGFAITKNEPAPKKAKSSGGKRG